MRSVGESLLALCGATSAIIAIVAWQGSARHTTAILHPLPPALAPLAADLVALTGTGDRREIRSVGPEATEPAVTTPPTITRPVPVAKPQRAVPLAALLRDPKELECLARNIYWEAATEPPEGQAAVAAVTLNRLRHPGFPDTICGVVHQRGPGINCQFSWLCDAHPDTPPAGPTWEAAKRLASRGLSLLKDDPTGGALFFHAAHINPAWFQRLERVGIFGHNVFYRGRRAGDPGDNHPQRAAMDY